MQRKVPETVGNCQDLIERAILKGAWVMGDYYTSAALISLLSLNGRGRRRRSFADPEGD